MQRGQIDVSAQRIRQTIVLDVGSPDLRLQRTDVRGKKAVEPQRASFVSRESRSLVQLWRIEDVQSARPGFAATLAFRPALGYWRQLRDHSFSHGVHSLVPYSRMRRAHGRHAARQIKSLLPDNPLRRPLLLPSAGSPEQAQPSVALLQTDPPA